jgi:peroxiredoxin Q/BCP
MLAIGAKAPDFELEDDSGRPVRLSALLEDGPVLLYFDPMDFTPVCTREACMFRDVHEDLARGGIRVVGIGPQDASKHARFRARHGLPFPLLADVEKKVARAYDALAFLGLMVERVSYWIGADGTIRGAVRADFRLDRHRDFVRMVLEESGKSREAPEA